MAAKGWFRVSVEENHLVLYIFTADDLKQVKEVALTINPKYIINQLTWQELHNLTKCVIPAGQNPNNLASGNVMIPRGIKPDIVLWPI